jgi:hypothetical protein
MEVMPRVPEDHMIPSMLGELIALIAAENRKNDGLYSFAYYRGKWIELEFWNGLEQEVILPKDTRITREVIAGAMEAVRGRS